jgi:hypothetical protein
VLRVLHSMQLTAKHKVATPNWKSGGDVITKPTRGQAHFPSASRKMRLSPCWRQPKKVVPSDLISSLAHHQHARH